MNDAGVSDSKTLGDADVRERAAARGDGLKTAVCDELTATQVEAAQSPAGGCDLLQTVISQSLTVGHVQVTEMDLTITA